MIEDASHAFVNSCLLDASLTKAARWCSAPWEFGDYDARVTMARSGEELLIILLGFDECFLEQVGVCR